MAGTGLSDTSPTAREEFAHGPDGAVYLRTSTWDDGGTQRKEVARVFGPYEKRTRTSGGSTTTVERTRLGGGVVHVKVTPATGTATERYEYLHGDQLGSLESASGATGSKRGAFAWDPYGSRRKLDWTGALDAAGTKTVADAQDQDARDGFTGHQQLDRIGLVHMRGRLYDPALGRFLSPDPVVADAGDGQGWNAYAYARNAPLSWVDPDGRQICDPRQCGSIFGNDPLAGGRGGFSSGTFSAVLTGGFRVAPVAVTASYWAPTIGLVRTGPGEWGIRSGLALHSVPIVTAALAATNAEGPVPDGNMGRDAASGAMTFGAVGMGTVSNVRHAQRPSYEDAESNYPEGSSQEVFGKVGGMVAHNGLFIDERFRWFNSCTVRISHVLNLCGFPIKKDVPESTVSGNGGKYWYLHRVRELEAYLRREWGPPDVVVTHERGQDKLEPGDLGGSDNKGILIIDVGGAWGSATGHATLWDGTTTIDNTNSYISDAKRLLLWKLE